MPTGTHLRQHKSLTKLRTRFYWPGMRTSTNLYVRTCKECKKRKNLNPEQQKDYYDLTVPRFLNGDQVWIWTSIQEKGSKFRRPWSGPYVVKKAISDVTYHVEDLQKKGRRLIVNFNRMKKVIWEDMDLGKCLDERGE